MKRFLFMIFVILMTPIYLIICVLQHLIGWMEDIGQPIVEGIITLTEDMTEFWRKILKGRKKNEE